jgi:hypothetical protein
LTPKGNIDTTFNYGTGFNADTRWVAEDSQGRIYVAGNFTTYKGTSVPRIIRLLSNGDRDTSFTPPSFNGVIISGVLVNDLPIVIGYFSTPRNGIVKLSEDGSIDTSFNVGTGFSPAGGADVYQIKNDTSGNLFVVGRFTSYNGASSRGIVKILPNGTRDTSFVVGTGFVGTDGMYTCTIQDDGKIIVGGYETNYNGTAINKLVRLMPNGSRDASLTTYPLNTTTSTSGIRSIVDDAAGNLYIGGVFTTYGGLSYPNFVKTNNSGSIDTAYLDGTSQFNNTLWHIIPYNTTT